MYGERFDLLLGRRTYDLWSGFWPKAPKSPMANRLNAATKYVVTHRPESLEWGPFEGIGADLVESVRSLKAKDGPDLIVSGSPREMPILVVPKGRDGRCGGRAGARGRRLVLGAAGGAKRDGECSAKRKGATDRRGHHSPVMGRHTGRSSSRASVRACRARP